MPFRDPEQYKRYQKEYRIKNKERLSKWEKEYWKKPEVRERQRNRELKKLYGIDLNEYNLLLESQDYGCAICGSTETGAKSSKNFCVDHCHETGKVRGLLCKSCNIMLGEAKDNPSILSKGIDYFMRFNSGLG
jgi:hypothetical protein